LEPFLDAEGNVTSEKALMTLGSLAANPVRDLSPEQRALHDAAANKFGAWQMVQLARWFNERCTQLVRTHGGTITRERWRHGRREYRTVERYQGARVPVVGRARAREHRSAVTRRTASSSETSSSDPGPSDEPGPPRGRLCAAPWCSHPVSGPPNKVYCGTERCDRARAAERQRQSRSRTDDLVELERQQQLADARLAGYVGSGAFAGPREPSRRCSGHALSFLWTFGLVDGEDPGEFEALRFRSGSRRGMAA
jgi:hypothetical protein